MPPLSTNHRSEPIALRPYSPLRNQRGVTLLIVLVMVVVLGLAAGMAGSTWKSVMQQARERELLWRGDQYRRALESYYLFKHGGVSGMFPTSLEALLKDPRSAETVRHLRRLYDDPFTMEPFELIREGGTIEGSVTVTPGPGRIIGVRSSSRLEPFRQDGFEEPYRQFAGANSYADWEFVFDPVKLKKKEQDQAQGKVVPQQAGGSGPGEPAGEKVEGQP